MQTVDFKFFIRNMAEVWIWWLEFNLGTRASREYVFSPQFTQLEHVNEEQRSGIMKEYSLCRERTPLNTDVALSLNVGAKGSFMFRRMNNNGRSRYSMNWRNLVVDNIHFMYGNDAREMMSRVDELCKLQNLQIIATSEPTNLYHREIRVIQI
ncbi:unnamed protein product [Caenorhabditis brenneri]